MKFKLGELFCGPGGIGLGAAKTKVRKGGEVFSIEHAWATDYDQDSCDTYQRNLSNGRGNAVVCADIRRMSLASLEDISPIDALAFGFPCNDFSIVGKKNGINGNFGPLYAYGIRALRHFKPKWFVAENVGGLKSSNGGRAIDIIFEEMLKAGYRIYPHLYKFERYGIPQTRHRIIIVGIRKDLEVGFGIPSSASYAGADITCGSAIGRPPIKENAPNHDFPKQSKTVIERLKHIKPGENAFNADLPDHLKLNIKGAKISLIYKRLDSEKPSYTVTGSGGGGTHVYHWKENRALTNRERARLQTFPDNFIFCGSKESVRKQIGMAVPPKAARIVFEAVLRSFAGADYSKTDPNIQLVGQGLLDKAFVK